MDALMETVIFRDLPGVADLELLLKNKHRLYVDERQRLFADINKMSIQLFGITAADTFHPPVPDGMDDDEAISKLYKQWDEYFYWLNEPFRKEEETFWQIIGIDMSANEDEYLECLGVFGRQIVCAARNLLPAASFRFRPSDPRTDEQIEAEAEAWGRSLLE